MKLYKLLLATALVCALVIGASQAASSHSITLTWDLPVTTADMGDCLTAGYPIPEEKPIITRIQWRVLGTSTWNTADTFNRQNIYTLQNLPPETTYEIRVGSHYGAGNVLCWTNTIQATTPAIEPPQGCTNLQVTDIE